MKGAITSILLLAAIQAAMCNVTSNPAIFFPSIDGNLTKISWAHAVNSLALLNETLEKGDIMMLEADVVLGTLNTTNDPATNNQTIPILAHPPDNSSDLSLQNFLNIVTKNGTKGIKLDFKSIEAFNESKAILEHFRNSLKFPVFINADILPGPVNATTKPVNANAFISGAKDFPEFTLSVGWTTRYGAKENITEGRYTEKQVQNMIDTLKGHNVTQPITYPVRAGLAANGTKEIMSLMENSSSNATLTIWSSEGDKVDVENLSKLIREVGVKKVYVDVPADLMKQLKLSGASSVSVTSMMILGSLLISLFLSSFLRRV
ncbi:protein FAM151B [Calliopsis andreniformis]|uniref:protein FAM151B n=1 Tax=Calliopsis andreniformis TaxID=337506 RepID=UPI003FCCCEF9